MREPRGFKVEILFMDDLMDFLPHYRRGRPILVSGNTRRSVKDLIESLGIPHTELGMIELNGEVVKMSQVIGQDCRIRVYPRVMKDPNRVEQDYGLRFLVDVHLGSLTRKMRLLGIDTGYNRHWDDVDLAFISSSEDRILLTRDRRLLMRKTVLRGYFVRSTNPDQQVIEVLNRFDLRENCRPFSRCLICNGQLRLLGRNQGDGDLVENQIPSKVKLWCQDFTICEDCRKIYWKGSHYERLKKQVEGFLS